MTWASFLDPVLNPLMSIPSPYNILLLSLLITLVTTLAYKFFTNQKLMKDVKEEMACLQKEIKTIKDNKERVMELQKQVMEKNMKYLGQSLKPTLITFIPLILIFAWLQQYYSVLGNPKVLFGLSWIWVYIIFSILFSLGLRKVLKIY